MALVRPIGRQTQWFALTPAHRLRACPSCRGYSLERQWCSVCNRSGSVIEQPKQEHKSHEL